ncbi:SsrA-binding protein SmpB [Candidatus Gracilibacteria bacterium]|nr:SsrA-binding protein SmpB [Candidatus Gracilibacteria bacterium]
MILLENKRILFDYEILDTFEAGIKLEGWEVKSLRAKHGNLKSAWVRIHDGEAFLENFQVSPYRFSAEVQDRDRPKKLLLAKREIEKIEAKLQEKGRTVAPIKIYTKGHHLKCEIVIGKGRKKYEKRQVLKDRSVRKEARQALKNFNAR